MTRFGKRFDSSRLRRLARCPRGASAVEFAILLPLFLMLVFGIVVFGAYFTMVHGVQQLAAEAARSSVAGLSEAERVSLAESYITANAGSYPLLQPARLSVSAATSGSDVFVVTVNYDASGNFIYTLPFVPSPPTTIVRSAAIPFGGF
ncbi:TadE/TadG family type IV pilus assembly protein [Nitrobacter sp.]|jgi:Flp pilus assembly protein TadG|uniref:TadE/TadG family type IV pilus assembly protein n=1 Tax=Nitrobacter sp. TaxID=29420 RepID=UPI003F64A1D3